MDWTANDRISQYYNYICLSERNLELARLKTLSDKACHAEHFANVEKELLNLNETLKRKLTINESNIRNVIQQDWFLEIPSEYMQDNLCNDRSLTALKQAINEQKTLIRKTTVIGRSVIDKVMSLNKDLKKSTIGFNIDRARNMKSLVYHKTVLTKERTAIRNASMEEIDRKRWESRYAAITPSMVALEKEKERLHNTIENLKHTSLTVWEAKILKEMDAKTQKIMQLEKDIYENETVYKELDATIENTKHYVRGGCTLDTSSLKCQQDNIITSLEKEKANQTALKASLARLKSLHMRLDHFFAYIPQILNQNTIESVDSSEQEVTEQQITMSALLRLFQPEQTME
uniref:Uncharacterized protein n=1 Tax=Anopheles minimus TaxID=112268 RepID=A0A182WM85_9DIPT